MGYVQDTKSEAKINVDLKGTLLTKYMEEHFHGPSPIPSKNLFKLEWQGLHKMWMRDHNKALIKAVANMGEKGKSDYIGSFEFDAELAAKKDEKVLKFNLICPELGLQDKNALRLELVHKFIDYDHSDQEKLNFEVSAAVAFFGFRNEGKIKMQRRLSRSTENDFPIPSKEDSYTGELVFYSDYLKNQHISPMLSHLADASLEFGC